MEKQQLYYCFELWLATSQVHSEPRENVWNTTARKRSHGLQFSAHFCSSTDENIVDIDFQVVWNIKNSSDFLFSLKEPEQSIRAISEAAMREVIAQSELAPILNRDRAAIEANVRQLIQKTLDERQTGISVVRVNFNKVDPPSRQVIVTASSMEAYR